MTLLWPADDERSRAILHARALELARRPPDRGAKDASEVVVLHIVGERYAVDPAALLEILPPSEITPVPGIPAVWAGVVNVRGSLYAALNLARALGLSATEAPAEPGMLLLIEGVDEPLAVGVDSVEHRIRTAASRPPTRSASKGNAAVFGLMEEGIALLDLSVAIAQATTPAEDDL